MKFPNVAWAAGQHGLTHYQLAAAAEMSESRFSRCFSGRGEFTSDERQKLASRLRYPADWLFQEVSPPAVPTDVRLERARALVQADPKLRKVYQSFVTSFGYSEAEGLAAALGGRYSEGW